MISATSSMPASRSEAVHEVVERIGQRGLHVGRQMRVDLGRPQALVAEDRLDEAQTHARGVEVRGVRMTPMSLGT